VRYVIFESRRTSIEPLRRLKKQLYCLNDEVSQVLAQLWKFEALTAVVVLMAKAKAIPPSMGLKQAAQRCYLRIQKNLLKTPEIAPAIEEVFVRIDEFFSSGSAFTTSTTGIAYAIQTSARAEARNSLRLPEVERFKPSSS